MSSFRKEEPTAPSAPPCYEEAVGGFPGSYVNHSQNVTSQVVPPYPQQQAFPVGYYVQPAPQPTVSPMPPSQPVINRPLPVGPRPLRGECPSCHAQIKTKVEYRNKYSPHICCFLLLVTVICSCFSCLPYCLCPAERTEHFCPKCNAFLGVYTQH